MAKGVKTGGGSRKGKPNKIAREFRETVRKLLEDNADNVALWLDKVAQTDPDKALDKLVKLAEFAAPKLSRAEVSGPDGGAITVTTINASKLSTAALKELANVRRAEADAG